MEEEDGASPPAPVRPAVRSVRDAWGMTQAQFAAILQINRTTLASVETGNLPMPLNAISWFAALRRHAETPDEHKQRMFRASRAILVEMADHVASGTLTDEQWWCHLHNVLDPLP